MDTLLLAIKLGRKRDVIEARQRARQLAALLGFDGDEQTLIAAGVFALAWQTLRRQAGATLYFQVKRRILHVFSGKKRSGAIPASLRIARRLPAKALFARDDIKWMLRELAQQPVPNLFEEIARLNQELLAALVRLRRVEPAEAPRWPVARDKTA